VSFGAQRDALTRFRPSLGPRPGTHFGDRARRRTRDPRGGGAPAAGTVASSARTLRVDVGVWKPALTHNGLGLLVLEGALLRRTRWDQRVAAELLGPGDLIRPRGDLGTGEIVRARVSWRAVTPARLAILDRAWMARMAPWPAVALKLTGRALERSSRISRLMAVDQVRRLELRVWLVACSCHFR
jgi:hypothetical protein